jgi:hypothetical protein
MRLITTSLISFIFLGLFFSSCEESTIEPSTYEGVDYYPISIGKWSEYSVEHIIVDVRTDYHDTIRYNLKEIVSQIISENEYETVYLVERNIRTSNDKFWQPYDAIQIIKNDTRVIRSVNNSDEFILPTKVVKGDIWNGNAYNTTDSVAYKIAKTDSIYLLNETLIDSVIRVQHEKFTSLINIENVYELYAPEIGLLYSESIKAESQNVIIGSSGEPIPVLNRVEVGEFFFKTLIDYGDNSVL